MKEYTISDVAELKDVVLDVLDILNNLKPNHSSRTAVVGLHGDLGAGKTTFVQTLARELGINETVTSPTFVVMKFYDTSSKTSARDSHADRWKKLIHIDAYRIEDIDEMRVLRFSELLEEKDTIICIEWAEKIGSLLPDHTIHLKFKIEGEERVITIDDKKS